MPVFKTGDMWSAFGVADYFIITTNAIVKNDGALVMGRGIAQQARDRFPGLDHQLGQVIKRLRSPYGCVLMSPISVFQVKYHWRNEADLSLIAYSAQELNKLARKAPHRTFALNFPGIGNGRLNAADVRPLLTTLPDNVEIWSFT